MRYTSSSKKEPRSFSEKIEVFWQKNEGVILDDGNFDCSKRSLYLRCSSRKRTVFVSFTSFEKYELRMRKKISKNFFPVSCPKTPSMKKQLTSYLGKNVEPRKRLYNLRNLGPCIRSRF